uniref:Uncharacterized protein n=1 Tax=viral metagenome TaxID=1070528 RepID=A0A6H1ZZ88_9ZZZZ
MPLTPKGKKIKAAMMKPKKQTEHRPFSDPLEKRWIIWGLNGEKIDIVADKAFQDNGILALYNKNGKVGVFKEFRAAL